jgi:site-specific DNA-methyltransferase (adenine-specific)
MCKYNFIENPFGLNQIYSMSCIDGMKKLGANSIDFVIADPPYNLSKGNALNWKGDIKNIGFGGQWIKTMEDWDTMPLMKYAEFTFLWLSEVKRILKPSGSFWIFGTYHNIGIINFTLQILEMEIINDIIWFKRNAFPQLSKRRFTASHETIIWGHTGTSKKRDYYFNYDYTKNIDFPEDLIKNPGKQMRTVWDIPNNKKKEEIQYGKHPTQKPIRIIERILNSTTKENWAGLIPFAGVGSECVACSQNNRNFIGFEINNEYIQIANKRLANKGLF